MIFHIAFKVLIFFILEDLAFKFAKNGAVLLVEYIGQHIQAAAVGHAHHKFLYAQSCTILNYGIQCRYQAFETFYRKAFLADVFGMNKALKNGSLIEFFEKMAFLVGGQVRNIAGFFKTLLQPASAARVADVGKLTPDALAIGLLQQLNDVFKRGVAQTHLYSGTERSFQICFAEPEVLNVQGW